LKINNEPNAGYPKSVSDEHERKAKKKKKKNTKTVAAAEAETEEETETGAPVFLFFFLLYSCHPKHVQLQYSIPKLPIRLPTAAGQKYRKGYTKICQKQK